MRAVARAEGKLELGSAATANSRRGVLALLLRRASLSLLGALHVYAGCGHHHTEANAVACSTPLPPCASSSAPHPSSSWLQNCHSIPPLMAHSISQPSLPCRPPCATLQPPTR